MRGGGRVASSGGLRGAACGFVAIRVAFVADGATENAKAQQNAAFLVVGAVDFAGWTDVIFITGVAGDGCIFVYYKKLTNACVLCVGVRFVC